ncbi:MAG TPA: signal peptidase I [Nocardioides sp.]|nr:signal peptidase I [Nocardioides sp.]
MTRRIGSSAAKVVAWTAIVAVAAALVAAVLVPRLYGATPYTVLTGSMRPHYPPGTLVVVKPVEPEDLRTGDVITYQLRSGRPTVVTHRVTAVSTDLRGDLTFTTQGDANDIPDEPVRPVQVRGRLWYAVPYLGYADLLLSGKQRHVAVLGAAGGLSAYALLMFAGAVRGRSRRREAPA